MLFSYFKRKLKSFLFYKGWVHFVGLKNQIEIDKNNYNLYKTYTICCYI